MDFCLKNKGCNKILFHTEVCTAGFCIYLDMEDMEIILDFKFYKKKIPNLVDALITIIIGNNIY